jgi:hypothetical protein
MIAVGPNQVDIPTSLTKKEMWWEVPRRPSGGTKDVP